MDSILDIHLRGIADLSHQSRFSTEPLTTPCGPVQLQSSQGRNAKNPLTSSFPRLRRVRFPGKSPSLKGLICLVAQSLDASILLHFLSIAK